MATEKQSTETRKTLILIASLIKRMVKIKDQTERTVQSNPDLCRPQMYPYSPMALNELKQKKKLWAKCPIFIYTVPKGNIMPEALYYNEKIQVGFFKKK